MKSKLIILTLLLSVFVSSASATDYYLKIDIQQIDSISNDSIAWSPAQKITLNKTESREIIGGMSVNFNDLQESDMTVSLKLTGSTISDALMKKTTDKCIKGTSQGLCNQVGHIKLTLTDIVTKTTSTTGTTTVNSSNPFNVYYYMDKKVALKEGGTRTFDVATYLSQNDLTQDDAPEEVPVYFESAIPFGITVTGGTFEPKWSWTGNTVKYIIEESATYVFTVKYKQSNPSGYQEDKTDTYKFITKGLASGSTASNTVSVIASYDVLLGDNKEIKMSQSGKFTGQEGVTISSQGADSFVFKFTTVGQYHLKFTADSGSETYVDFNVKSSSSSSSPQTTTTPAEDTTVANQVTDLTGGNNYLILIPIALIILGIVLMKKRKQISRPKIRPPGVQ